MRRRLLKILRRRVECMERVFRQYTAVLRNLFPRSTLILFGSRARGDYAPYSDYDVMVVVPVVKGAEKLRIAEEVLKVKPRELAVDVLPVGVEELDDPIIRKMLSEGCVILHDGLGLINRLRGLCRAAGS